MATTNEFTLTSNASPRVAPPDGRESKTWLWTGRVLSGLAILFLLFDSLGKLMRVDPAIQGSVDLGYPASAVLGIGVTLLICTILYAIPRTAVLGAILLTGYLGGAVATHVRVENPLFSHILFPCYVGLFVWGGLYLRDRRVRALIPLRTGTGRET
ncbi:MAG TPA: DoxX family protein [Longimicrobiaceae bacterium]|nr:DoxX family protein [Longimicrobiaceae bacterium]